MQILRRLYQVGGSLNGLTWDGGYKSYADSNVYLLVGEDGLILFDCGNGETWEQICANIRYWGLNPSDICACFLTHAHLDHTGAAYLLERQGAPLYSHTQTAAALAAGDERCATYLYHQSFNPCKVSHPLEDGDEVTVCGVQIRALHCPGHSAGCTAFCFTHEEKKIVISGDIIGTLLDGYFGWDGSIDFDRAVYLRTLQRFARVDSDIMLPGHGLVYFHKPRQRVEEAFCMALSSWR